MLELIFSGPDRPGACTRLLACLTQYGAGIVSIQQQRGFASLQIIIVVDLQPELMLTSLRRLAQSLDLSFTVSQVDTLPPEPNHCLRLEGKRFSASSIDDVLRAIEQAGFTLCRIQPETYHRFCFYIHGKKAKLLHNYLADLMPQWQLAFELNVFPTH